MTQRVNIVAISSLALAVVVLAGILTPVCTMPECDAAALSACSSSQPACDDCDDSSAVMKHSPDQATTADGAPVPSPIAGAAVPALPVLAPARLACAEPAVTASPPPLDPLGVRLTI